MTTLDLIFIVIGAASAVLAFFKGFLKECLSLLALAVGLVLAARLYPQAAVFLARWVEAPALRSLLAFLAVFFAVLVLAGAIMFISDRLLKWSHLKGIDRLLGVLFGLVRGWLICTVLVLAMTAFGWHVTTLQRSRLAPYLLLTARAAVRLAPPEMRRNFDDEYARIYQHWLDLMKDYRGGEEGGPAPQNKP